MGDGWARGVSAHSSTGGAQNSADALHVSRAVFFCAHHSLCICHPSLSPLPDPPMGSLESSCVSFPFCLPLGPNYARALPAARRPYPLGPTGSSTAGPGCFHPPPQQSYFQLLVVEAATPTPQGEELRSPACGVSGDSGCHLPLGALGSSGSPQAVAAWCMARASLPAVAPTLPILSWQQHGGTGNSSFLCKPFPGPVCCVPLGDHTGTPRLGFPQALCTHPSLGSSAAPDSLPGRGIPCGSRG